VLFVAVQTDAYGIPWLACCMWWLAGSALTGWPPAQSRATERLE
jgi:hypothetical protein